MPADDVAVTAPPPQAYQAGGWTPGLHKLASVGDATQSVVGRLLGADPAITRIAKLGDGELVRLADALGGWSDGHAAHLIEALHTELAESGQHVDVKELCGWVSAHRNDPEAVLDCVSVHPPDGVTVLNRLSKAGSQKRVYLASWAQAPDHPVVLKRLLGTRQEQLALLSRELQSHPLTVRHPNIIATHLLFSAAEPFLVEERLHDVVNDGWRAGGQVEAANLLNDVAHALAYIHEVRGWVHGDVKPDNIGRKDGTYILLDFGICRPAAAFTREATATGSLRTRAPELFDSDAYDDAPQKADVWALGATVYRAVTGRFLFIDEAEAVPRISDPDARTAFEQVIRGRVESEWESRVIFDGVPEPLAGVLRRVLVRSPGERLTAKQLVRLCGQKLAAFLRSSAPAGPAPEEEVGQLLRHLTDEEALRLMPAATKQNLVHRLRDAQRLSVFPPGQDDRLSAILKVLE